MLPILLKQALTMIPRDFTTSPVAIETKVKWRVYKYFSLQLMKWLSTASKSH